MSGEVPDAEVIARAIADAEAEIDGYLAARYALPLAVVPPILSRLAAELARYFLRGTNANESERDRYGDVVRTLRAIGRGEMVLEGGDALGAGVGLNEADVLPSSRPLAFGRST